jgi:hypothetical protein
VNSGAPEGFAVSVPIVAPVMEYSVITEKAAKYNVILLTCRKSTINPEIILANVFVIPINETSKAL